MRVNQNAEDASTRSPVEKRKVGRPRWTAPELEVVEKLASRGLTDKQVAHALGICHDTLINYKRENSEFFDALKKGRSDGLFQVANALFAEAVQGSVTAQMFYLKCRDRENWSDKNPPEQSKETETPEKPLERL